MAYKPLSKCQTKSQLKDDFALSPIMSGKKKKAAKRREGSAFCVYFMEIIASGHVKIGRTSNISNRIRSVAVDLGLKPDDIRTLGRVMVKDRGESVKLEAALHKHFKHRRSHGEWFDIYDQNLLHEVIGVADATLGSGYKIQGLASDHFETSDKWTMGPLSKKKLIKRRRGC